MARPKLALYRVLVLVIACSTLVQQQAEAKSPPKAQATAKLAARIDKLLEEPDMARSFWGIEVTSLDNGKTLYSHNSDKLFTPASNTKLFTTAAVLALIGPDYKFRTTVESANSIDRYGRLIGDLALVGRGDP